MIRVCEFKMDNVAQKFGVMSTAIAEKFIEDVNQMRAEGKAQGESWADHKRQIIADAINRAEGKEEWTVARVREEFDLLFVDSFYGEIRSRSGIVTSPGEVPAA
jgi:predicted neutral ceramidase superfamily lipid hydrolase